MITYLRVNYIARNNWGVRQNGHQALALQDCDPL